MIEAKKPARYRLTVLELIFMLNIMEIIFATYKTNVDV